jgi:hypothetical protein
MVKLAAIEEQFGIQKTYVKMRRISNFNSRFPTGAQVLHHSFRMCTDKFQLIGYLKWDGLNISADRSKAYSERMRTMYGYSALLI